MPNSKDLIILGTTGVVAIMALTGVYLLQLSEQEYSPTFIDDDDICAICYDSLNDRPQDTSYLNCYHRFHDICIERLRRSNTRENWICPKCRQMC